MFRITKRGIVLTECLHILTLRVILTHTKTRVYYLCNVKLLFSVMQTLSFMVF